MFLSKSQSDFIKFIAIISMAVDHIGYVLYPEIYILRIIGRISFFLFAYQLAVSYDKTSDIKKFSLRLFLFALISQVPYFLIFHHGLNIGFTLFFGLCAIWLSKKYGFLAGLLILPFAELLQVDFGFFGAAVILISYFLKSRIPFLALAQAAFYSFALLFYSRLRELTWIFAIEPIGFLAFPLIAKAPKLPFRLNKYVFYIFYPAHLLLLYGIRKMINYL